MYVHYIKTTDDRRISRAQIIKTAAAAPIGCGRFLRFLWKGSEERERSSRERRLLHRAHDRLTTIQPYTVHNKAASSPTIRRRRLLSVDETEEEAESSSGPVGCTYRTAYVYIYIYIFSSPDEMDQHLTFPRKRKETKKAVVEAIRGTKGLSSLSRRETICF